MECLAAIGRRLHDFMSRAEGNVTILVSIAALAMFGCAGAAIDYVRMSREQTLLSSASDAAALAAVIAAKSKQDGGTEDKEVIRAAAVDAGLLAWKSNVAGSAFHSPADPRIIMTENAGGWGATVTFDTKAPVSFMNLFGLKDMRLSGRATASGGGETETATEFWDIHLVVDNSSSMGLGATPADMEGMEDQFNCAFACHMPPNPFGGSLPSLFGASPDEAHAAGFKLRIDIVDEAVDALVDHIDAWPHADKLQLQLWGLNSHLVSLVDKTRRFRDVKDADIEIVVESTSIGDTDYHAVMAALDEEVGASGSGKSPVDPRKAVFIVTDGMHDSSNPTPNYVSTWNSNHFIGTMDPVMCDALKAKGIKVGVLYIDYYTPQGYAYVTDPVINDLKPRLMACASDGLFYNATSAAGIAAALTDMAGKAVAGSSNAAVRLTN